MIKDVKDEDLSNWNSKKDMSTKAMEDREDAAIRNYRADVFWTAARQGADLPNDLSLDESEEQNLLNYFNASVANGIDRSIFPYLDDGVQERLFEEERKAYLAGVLVAAKLISNLYAQRVEQRSKVM